MHACIPWSNISIVSLCLSPLHSITQHAYLTCFPHSIQKDENEPKQNKILYVCSLSSRQTRTQRRTSEIHTYDTTSVLIRFRTKKLQAIFLNIYHCIHNSTTPPFAKSAINLRLDKRRESTNKTTQTEPCVLTVYFFIRIRNEFFEIDWQAWWNCIFESGMTTTTTTTTTNTTPISTTLPSFTIKIQYGRACNYN